MEWLENNAYSRQLSRSGMRVRCGVYAFFALVLGWLAMQQLRDNCYILQADSGIQVEGYVERHRDGYKKRRLEVAMEYQGKTYTIVRTGQRFTSRMFDEAIETRRVTVYVNPENPAESVLSLGVPPETWIVYSLVGVVELVLLGCSGYFFCLYYRKEEAADV